jgi:hypothetical protein
MGSPQAGESRGAGGRAIGGNTCARGAYHGRSGGTSRVWDHLETPRRHLDPGHRPPRFLGPVARGALLPWRFYDRRLRKAAERLTGTDDNRSLRASGASVRLHGRHGRGRVLPNPLLTGSPAGTSNSARNTTFLLTVRSRRHYTRTTPPFLGRYSRHTSRWQPSDQLPRQGVRIHVSGRICRKFQFWG